MSNSTPTSAAELDRTEWNKMISSQPWSPQDPYIKTRQLSARNFLREMEAEVDEDVQMKMVHTLFDMEDGAMCQVKSGFKCEIVRKFHPAPGGY